MILGVTDSILDELENGTTISSLNTRITEVNTARTGTAPAVATFWDYDLPQQFTEAELPAIYVQSADFVARPGNHFNGQRVNVITLEIGLFLTEFPAEEWRPDAAVIAEALSRCLDDVRDLYGLGEYVSEGYTFLLTGWGAPGANAPQWGGFICTAQIAQADDLT